MIRNIQKNDFGAIHSIWDKFYKDQFPFPDFLNYICAFVVCDDNDKIVTAGGIRPIAEVLLITDKSALPRTRIKALVEIKQANEFMARTKGFNNLYAFIKDDAAWQAILERIGFKKEQVLYMEL